MIEMPAFPLSIAHLPGDQVGLRIFEPRYLAMVDRLEEDRAETLSAVFATMLIERGSEVGGGDVRCRWGVTVNVVHIDHGPHWCHLIGRASDAIVVRAWLGDDPFPRASVDLQAEVPLERDERFDVASSLTLLAGRVVHLLERVGHRDFPSGEGRLSVIAEGRWWGDTVSDEELWRAYWSVCRSVPCGPLDRHGFLGPGALPDRVRRAREVVDHVGEVLTFGSID